MTDPNITVGAAESTKEYGLKENVATLLTENKAIAGTNGDFFGLKGDYAASFGPVFKDGKLVHFIERHHIEGRSAEMISEHLKETFEQFC